jgi:hypothetical protein
MTLAFALGTLTGCTSYYRVTDPPAPTSSRARSKSTA